MVHDLDLVDRLSAFTPVPFDGELFRATRKSLDPLAPSASGGRWAAKGGVSVLYMSCARDGALAELAFHWGQQVPLPSKPASLHRIAVSTKRTIRLIRADLESLGVDWKRYGEAEYDRTQQIGAAIDFLGYDGLVAPSARWNCENLMLFFENHRIDADGLRLIETEEVNWLAWAREHAFCP